MALEELFTMLYPPVGPLMLVAVLAVLWKYSALPEIDWKYITAGTMLFLVGAMLLPFSGYTQDVQQVELAVTALGAILVIIGALLNLVGQFK